MAVNWLKAVFNPLDYSADLMKQMANGTDIVTAINSYNSASNEEKILGEIENQARQEYLDDRAHTEAREDSAYQRAVADMQKAGLNPFTVGSNPASSSSSTVGEKSITNRLQILGYLLDLKNLDIKNKQVANQQINTVLNGLKLIPTK